MAGELLVRLRFKNSPRIFTVAMQIVDDEVPIILGANFLLEHDCLINYRTQEMLIPPTETEMASSTPITVNGTAKDHMVAALFPSDGCPTPETTLTPEQHTANMRR